MAQCSHSGFMSTCGGVLFLSSTMESGLLPFVRPMLMLCAMLAMFAEDKHWPAESTRKKGKREQDKDKGRRLRVPLGWMNRKYIFNFTTHTLTRDVYEMETPNSTVYNRLCYMSSCRRDERKLKDRVLSFACSRDSRTLGGTYTSNKGKP